jgi:hypothetical protein
LASFGDQDAVLEFPASLMFKGQQAGAGAFLVETAAPVFGKRCRGKGRKIATPTTAIGRVPVKPATLSVWLKIGVKRATQPNPTKEQDGMLIRIRWPGKGRHASVRRWCSLIFWPVPFGVEVSFP